MLGCEARYLFPIILQNLPMFSCRGFLSQFGYF